MSAGEVPLRLVDSIWEDHESQPGDAKWYISSGSPHRGSIAGLLARCPCGCGDLFSVAVWRPEGEPGPCWTWDGQLEQPTLTPSIHRHSQCGWHGFLTGGVFRRVQ